MSVEVNRNFHLYGKNRKIEKNRKISFSKETQCFGLQRTKLNEWSTPISFYTHMYEGVDGMQIPLVSSLF